MDGLGPDGRIPRCFVGLLSRSLNAWGQWRERTRNRKEQDLLLRRTSLESSQQRHTGGKL
jgi:hypothetical protein